MEQLTIDIEPALLARLRALAAERDLAVGDVVREALEAKACEVAERSSDETGRSRLSFIASGRSNYTDTSVLAGEIGMGPPPWP